MASIDTLTEKVAAVTALMQAAGALIERLSTQHNDNSSSIDSLVSQIETAQTALQNVVDTNTPDPVDPTTPTDPTIPGTDVPTPTNPAPGTSV